MLLSELRSPPHSPPIQLINVSICPIEFYPKFNLLMIFFSCWIPLLSLSCSQPIPCASRLSKERGLYDYDYGQRLIRHCCIMISFLYINLWENTKTLIKIYWKTYKILILLSPCPDDDGGRTLIWSWNSLWTMLKYGPFELPTNKLHTKQKLSPKYIINPEYKQ